MKSLKPDGRIDLEHRAYFLRGSTESSTIVAASEDGRVSLVDFGSNSAMANRPTTKIRKISPHPKESPFAYAESKTGALHVRTLPGELIAELEPPSLSDDASRSMTQGFKDWHFDEGGDFLWLVAPVSDNECELSLVETKSWSVTQSVVLEDHFGQSSFSFHSKENPGHISLWVAGGQDGQEVYFLKRDVIGFSFNRIEKLANCLPPVFSHDGSELLTVTESKSICRYGFPSINLLGPPCISSDKNDPFAESLCYLDSRYALVGTCEQRIFLIVSVSA